MDPKRKIIADFTQLSRICRAAKEKGKKVVLTSGCFDLLHGGHLDYVCEAGMLGYLVVGINSDAFVKRIKGDNRPIRNEQDRAFTMAGFFPVKLVSIFDCDYALIEAVQPDVYVASATSHVKVWSDQKRIMLLNQLGSQVVEIGSLKKDSTTDIIKRAVADAH